jgi:hypothetical protein
MESVLGITVLLAGVAFLGWVLVSLVRRLREERATQAPHERSNLWVLIAAGVGAYAFAYVAFGEQLQAPLRLALAALTVISVAVARRRPHAKH